MSFVRITFTLTDLKLADTYMDVLRQDGIVAVRTLEDGDPPVMIDSLTALSRVQAVEAAIAHRSVGRPEPARDYRTTPHPEGVEFEGAQVTAVIKWARSLENCRSFTAGDPELLQLFKDSGWYPKSASSAAGIAYRRGYLHKLGLSNGYHLYCAAQANMPSQVKKPPSNFYATSPRSGTHSGRTLLEWARVQAEPFTGNTPELVAFMAERGFASSTTKSTAADLAQEGKLKVIGKRNRSFVYQVVV